LRRRGGCLIWLVIAFSVVALFLAWQYAEFRLAHRTLPAGMTMAGLAVGGMSKEQALNALELAFATPVEVSYLDQRFVLPPESVAFRHNVEETAANLERALRERMGTAGFVAHMLRYPEKAVAVPVAASYSAQRLDDFLARVAAQYDRPPQPIVPLPSDLTFRSARPGSRLDPEASRERLAAALLSAADRQATLVVQTEPPPSYDLNTLGLMLKLIVENHPGLVAGIFVKDLQRGDELGINADVAYSGMSVLKIAIVEEVYRVLEIPLAPEVSTWISQTIGVADSNAAANLLLAGVLGNGDGYRGAENLSASMRYLGLSNTFMAAPYDETIIPYTVVTPANARADITTNAAPGMQTTPMDMGLLLEMIYRCSRGGGALVVAYPGAFTAEECDQMLEWIGQNRTDSLIEAGVPAGTRVVHKHGLAGDTYADVALVFSAGGDFVLTVFLHRPQWLAWEEGAPLIADIAKATYNYFNPLP